MKRILISDHREELLSTLEVILKNWGYRALVTSDSGEFATLLKELEPELIISGPSFVSEKTAAKIIKDMKLPLLLIDDPAIEAKDIKATEKLSYPIDVFKLFEFTQKNLEKIPRRNIRLNVQLPSMYYHGESPCIAEVVSLSTEGLFIRTGSRIEGLEQVQIILPLLGMHKEIEVEGRIVYRVEPHPDNNYLQGMGIEFSNISKTNDKLLKQFIENLLMNELSGKNYTQDALDMEQLQNRSAELTLKIKPLK